MKSKDNPITNLYFEKLAKAIIIDLQEMYDKFYVIPSEEPKNFEGFMKYLDNEE